MKLCYTFVAGARPFIVADNANNALPVSADAGFELLAQYYYDKMPARVTKGAELYPSALSADDFAYGTDKLNAVVTVLPAVAGVTDQNDGRTAVQSVCYRYDKYGRVLETYVYNGLVKDAALRLQKTETVYDLAGRITHTVKYPKGVATVEFERITERYTYDNLGRVAKITGPNNAVLTEYDYNPAGQVARAWLGDKSLRLDLEYHISGALKRTRAQRVVDGSVLYDEVLGYEDCGADAPTGCAAQYGGNIARMAQLLAHGNAAQGTQRDVAYAYDGINRLTAVNDAVQDEMDEKFAYDAQGRMAWQRRGSLATSSAGGEYHYAAGKNQLAWVDAGMSADNSRDMSGSASDPALEYDLNGNLVADYSKGTMTVMYDDRDMPLSYEWLKDGTTWRMLMRYDAGGARVAKVLQKDNAGVWEAVNATYYTGVGNEIRETPDNDVKVVVNMLQGLGRYAIGSINSFEWFLKNHIGNTMLVYNTGNVSAVKAAYDYRVFGKQVALVEPTDKVTEMFTGKELDGEIGLNYFGARYYDGDIGMWVSVDPKRQFPSPYLYSGNGFNPVNGVDADGNVFVGDAHTIYSNAVANNFWGSKTLQSELTYRQNSEIVYSGKLTNKISERGVAEWDGDQKNIWVNSKLSEFDQASTLMHESIETTYDSKLAKWHMESKMEESRGFVGAVIKALGWENFLKANADGNMGPNDAGKNYVDPVYKKEYDALVESQGAN